jgi:hypothetical protein
MSNKLPPDHLGDGVYVADQGYAITISVNDHRNKPVVTLEPDVLRALIRYSKRCDELRKHNQENT